MSQLELFDGQTPRRRAPKLNSACEWTIVAVREPLIKGRVSERVG
jgi:hypothetical protein